MNTEGFKPDKVSGRALEFMHFKIAKTTWKGSTPLVIASQNGMFLTLKLCELMLSAGTVLFMEE